VNVDVRSIFFLHTAIHDWSFSSTIAKVVEMFVDRMACSPLQRSQLWSGKGRRKTLPSNFFERGYTSPTILLKNVTSNFSKAHEMRNSLAVPVRRLSCSITIHFVVIHFRNLRRSHKLQKNTKTLYLESSGSFKVIDVDTTKSLSLLLFTRELQRVLAMVILSWCLSWCLTQPGTDRSPGEIETFGFHLMIA